jgi:hypothetical protein
LQRNKHNEQQPFNSEKLRNLGNARENPNVGKPNERERDLLFSFRKVHINNNNTISSKRKIPYNTQNCPKILPRFPCPRKSVLLYGFALFSTSKSVPTNSNRKLPSSSTENAEKAASKSVQQAASICVPSQPVVRTVRIRTVWPL